MRLSSAGDIRCRCRRRESIALFHFRLFITARERDKGNLVKKKLTLRRETIEVLATPLTRQARGAFSGIGTCVNCNITKFAGGCHPTVGCPQ
jgi:hypothetical protein